MTLRRSGAGTERVSVAEAKRRFSELMSRVAYSGERFLIERKGKATAALVKADDLDKLERLTPSLRQRGLLAATGAWADHPGLDQFVKDIYRRRSRAKGRKVSLG